MSMAGSSAGVPLVDAAMVEGGHGRMLVVALVRSLAIVAITLTIYAFIPIRPETAIYIGGVASLGLVVLFVVFARQLGRIARHPQPIVAAVESLALVVGMFLALFAFVYVSLSQSDPASFTQPIGKMAGIYFSVTILATVGFGDISAVTDIARAAVTVQMMLDLILIGAAVKLLGMSARRGVEAKLAQAGVPATELTERIEAAHGSGTDDSGDSRDPQGRAGVD